MKQSRPKKYGIVIDGSKCIDCKACMIACKVENNVPEGMWRNWIRPLQNMSGKYKSEFQPGQCMQCDDPSCVAACPVGATYKQADGLVVIDPKKCIGCGNCVSACPYGARYRNPEKKIADKCDFCQHRLKRGEEPACVITCPTKSRIFGDLNDPRSEVAKLVAEFKLLENRDKTTLLPAENTVPMLFYIDPEGVLSQMTEAKKKYVKNEAWLDQIA